MTIIQAPEMVFQPSLDQDATDGFCNMVESLLDDIFQFASLVPRVATHLEAQDYRVDLDEVNELFGCVQCVRTLLIIRTPVIRTP